MRLVEHIRLWLIRIGRWSRITALVLFAILVVAYTIGRVWLPSLIENKAEIEQYLSKAAKHDISLGEITTRWSGLHPGVEVKDIRIRTQDKKKQLLHFKKVQVSLSLWSAMQGKAIIHRLVLFQPELDLERTPKGKVRMAGLHTPKLAPDRQVGTEAIIDWLFSQEELAIKDGRLSWADHQGDPGRVIELSDVDLSLQNFGKRHLLKFSARFPTELCVECSVVMDIDGNPLLGKDWGGYININAVGLSLDRPPAIIAEHLPHSPTGTADLILRSQWLAGVPRAANGHVRVNALHVPLGKKHPPLNINEAIARVKWRGHLTAWSLEADLPFVQIDDASWQPGHLKVDHHANGTSAYLRHIDIKKMLSLAKHFDIPEKAKTYLTNIQPSGSVDDLSVDYRKEAEPGKRVRVRANLRHITTQPYRKIPGVENVNAWVDSSDTEGELFLNTSRSGINIPRVLRETIRVHRAKGSLKWARKPEHWEFQARNVHVVGHDISGHANGVFRLPFDHAASPYLELRADFFDGNVARKSAYLPVNVMKPALVNWLDASVLGGHVIRGHAIYRGNTRQFPFLNSEGLFEIAADVENGKLQFLPHWQPVREANVRLLFRGAGMLITGRSGKINRLDANQIVVAKENFKDPREPIRVSAHVDGPVQSTLAVLRNAVSNGQKGGWTSLVQPQYRPVGNGQLDLSLALPIKNMRAYTMEGDYRLTGNSLEFPVGDISLYGVRGVVHFNERQVVSGHVEATALGGPVDIRLVGQPQSPGRILDVHLNGNLTAAGLAREYGDWVTQSFAGAAQWSGKVRVAHGLPHISLTAKMDKVAVRLPDPVSGLSNTSDTLRIDTLTSTRNRHQVRLMIGSGFSGLLDYRAERQKWRFAEGHLLVGSGKPQLAGHQGLLIDMRGKYASLDAWLPVLYGRPGSENRNNPITRVNGQIGHMQFMGRDFGELQFAMKRQPGGWKGKASGDSLSGDIRVRTDIPRGKIDLQLEHLAFPEANEDKGFFGSEDKVRDPRGFPALTIRSKSFHYGKMDLGQLEFLAKLNRFGWELPRIQLTRPEMTLAARGEWFYVAGTHIARGNVKFNSSHLGNTLDALGYPGQVKNGSMKLDANIDWRPDKNRPGLSSLDGDIEMTAEEGTLVNLDPGAARLAGALSLQSLLRYMFFDFSPAVGKGFAFNEMKAKARIQEGNLQTDGFTVKSPSAVIVGRGRIGLHERDIDLHTDVYPNIRGGVTLATASLFGPQAAAWVFAFQQLFSSRIAEGTRISYRITGPWDNAKVVKLEAPKKQPEPEPEAQDF